MARIGAVLLGLQLITPDQLRQGVAAQILYGGRLGTNLVELGFVDMDHLASALGRRRGMPAALSGHFDLCDRDVQDAVPATLAERWKVVPLGRLAHDPSRIAIAAMDPLPADGRATLAGFLDVAPDQLVFALSPELRILYHLERAYGIARGIRFLRIRNPEPAPLPEAPFEEDSDVEIEIIREPEREPSGDALAVSEVVAELDDDTTTLVGDQPLPVATGFALDGDDELPDSDPPPPTLDYDEAPPLDDEIGRGQRRFVPSLGDAAVTLARIAVRHVEPFAHVIDNRERRRPTGAMELLRAVRRAESRDHVAQLVVGGLGDLGGLDTVAILVCRPPIALGWRGYCPAGERAIETLAVPLDQPGCLATIYAAATCASGSIDAADTSVIDQRMWELFGTAPPAEVLAAPIMLGSQVLCLLYAQAPVSLGAARDLGPALAAAAGVAFGRLLRAAQR